MNIAELMVRVSASTTDVNSKMRGVQQSLLGVERGAGGTKFAFNSMNSALSSLASQMTGVNPAVATLSRTIGSFALGGPVVAGALIGIAAIAKAYDLITRGAREAAEAQKKLADSLATMFAPKTGPRSQTSKAFNAALQERADLTKKLAQLETDRENPLISTSFLGKKLYDKRIEEVQQKIRDLNQSIADAMAGSIKSLDTVVVTGTTPLIASFGNLREEAAKVNAALLQDNKNFWRGYIEQTNRALTLTEELNRAINADRPSLVEAFRGLMTGAPGAVNMPNISMPFEGLTEKQKENLRELGVIKDDANRNANNIQNAIWGAAIQSANIIAGALNIGGGGRGSGIGGALGGAIGGAAMGGKLGAFGGPVGAVVGAIAGSFIGGLFDHKKAIERSIAATDRNTAMMGLLLNTPSGYKVARGRFDATEIKEFRQSSIRYATRGGAPVIVVA